MDMYTHTIIATACIAGAFYAGLYFSKRSIMNSIVSSMLDTLEKDGFIKTEINEDGEKTLVPVSEKWLVEPQSQNIYVMTNLPLLELKMNVVNLGICLWLEN